MLDADTKRRIDTARDILVGKVPDPKSQVEQITIALIYKFMDDIDAESEELGGQRQFFAGDFARYGWPQLVRAGLGGHEVLNLYAEAISRMPENPGIPMLFRDIFNNAYLPYRDPETLRAFLKVIDTFTYDHSERLGDAFEYLLSVLGSQGDAGQFRTPRHIIDFIVAILDPKKDETILDPACGTAGFLVSSYKHILQANADAEGHSTLTPDEKGKLAANFKGYDISPDMVRLSLVNLYLHRFVEPHVVEYDTLTSEERWNEYADVILANPPFMSPKGGIRPHRRFSVQSKRSEVLFVDYMAEHLTPAGRAGIIVPEGIIFQSQNAYKQLRKILVENYLVAVISLPAGVFQPYSGVKTSILILDKVLAKKTDRIGFFKVANDGFDLGAQRREIAENDLPQVQAEIAGYLGRLRASESVATDRAAESGMMYGTDESAMTHRLIAEKERIAAGGEYNLSGERYRETSALATSKWPLVTLREVCVEILSGGTPSTKNAAYWQGDIPWITSADIVDIQTAIPRKYITEAAVRESATNLIPRGNVIVVSRVGLGKLFRNDYDVCISQDSQGLILQEGVSAEYLVYVLKDRVANFKVTSQGSTIQGVTKRQLAELQVPLPPLELQRKIVAEIEGYQRVIDGSRAVIDNYRPQIVVDPEWPMLQIGRTAAQQKYSIKAGPFGSALKKESYVPHGYKIYGQEQVIRGDAAYGDYYINEEKYLELESCKVQPGDVLISLVGTYGKTLIVPHGHEPGIINPRLMKITLNELKITPQFFVAVFAQETVASQTRAMSHGGTMNILSVKILKALQIPVPPLETQQAIVAELEAEQALVNANRELIERFERKTQAAVGRVWGEDRVQGSTLKPDVGNEQPTMSERPSR